MAGAQNLGTVELDSTKLLGFDQIGFGPFGHGDETLVVSFNKIGEGRGTAPAGVSNREVEIDTSKLLGFDHVTGLDGLSVSEAEEAVATAFGKIGESANSDRRLKTDIVALGLTTQGIRLYRYRYLGGTRDRIGVIAQDLQVDPRHAHAVRCRPDGYLTVDYGALGLSHLVDPATRSEGEQAAVIGLMAA